MQTQQDEEEEEKKREDRTRQDKTRTITMIRVKLRRSEIISYDGSKHVSSLLVPEKSR